MTDRFTNPQSEIKFVVAIVVVRMLYKQGHFIIKTTLATT